MKYADHYKIMSPGLKREGESIRVRVDQIRERWRFNQSGLRNREKEGWRWREGEQIP